MIGLDGIFVEEMSRDEKSKPSLSAASPTSSLTSPSEGAGGAESIGSAGELVVASDAIWIGELSDGACTSGPDGDG